MLNRLIEFSLGQRLLVLLLAAMLAVFGVHAFLELPIDAFPDVSTTQVKIILKAPGMTPEEVEARIAVPIEQEMLGIPHEHLLRSTSKYGLSDITIDFNDGTDIYWARQQVSERLNGVMDDLPHGTTGGMAPITTPLGEMFMFTIEGPISNTEKRTLLDWVIRPQLRTIPGVADVNSLGGEVKTYEVVPDTLALTARGLNLGQLRSALEENNRNDGAGRLADAEEALLVRAEGAIQSLDDVRAIVLSSARGVVRLGDVAHVRFGSLSRYGAVTRNGEGEAVEGLVLGLRGANAQAVIAAVKARLAELGPSLPEGVEIKPFYDRSHLVERAISTVSHALLEAIVLVVALLLAFLGSVRPALVVAVILPLSALATFILMRFFGLSANLMSLGGLAIAIGMLVDAAVVVVENVETRLAHDLHTAGHKQPILPLVYKAASEVAVPVASGIVVIIIVFLPLLSLQGLEGKMFGPVALTIVFALSASLLLSLTVVPVLASWLLKQGEHEIEEPYLVRKLNAWYADLLEWALISPRKLFMGAAAGFLLALVIYTLLGKTFMPTMDEGDMIIQLEKLPSIGLEQTVVIDTRIQQAILEQVPEVAGVVARSGADELGLDPMGLNQTDTFLVLKPRDQWRKSDPEWLKDQLRKVLEDFPGIGFSFTQPIDMRVSEMLTGVRGDLAIKVFGPDLQALNHLAGEITQVVKGVPGAEDTFTLKNDGVQYLRIRIDRLAAGRLGLNVQDIQAELRTLLEGQPMGSVLEQGRRIPLVVRGNESLRASPADFAAQRITTPAGGSVPLSAVANIERVDGPVKVDRENAQRYVVVQSNVRDRDLVGFVEEARRSVVAKVVMPQGYRLVWGGQFENQQRAAARLALVVPASLVLIFFLLFSTFGSVRQAVLVLVNIPLALIGGVLGLAISGEYLSVPASVGFIALLGIAVLNGVVMVTYFNQLATQGMPLEQVVREGAKRRLRPVLMTASIAAFGLLPLLFATGPGSEVQKPLAIVVIGGLASSTALTLLLLPVLYRRFGIKN
ncbi:MAG: hypothetical protein RIR18_180 [Pseudomonadota bacterium]|jgi:cobalt-zinc-cadmium resistance protein CzcA